MQPGTLNISEMAALYDVSLRTLRFYEQIGLLRPLRIGTQRFYRPRERVMTELIIKGKRLGFSLHEIRQLIGEHAQPEDPDAAASEPTIQLNKTQICKQLRILESKRETVCAVIAELQNALTSKMPQDVEAMRMTA